MTSPLIISNSIAVPAIGRATQKGMRQTMQMQDNNAAEAERDDDALTVQEAARFLACSASKLNKARVNGAGPIFIKDGRSVRYLRRDLRDYRNARKRRSTSDAPAAATVAA